MSRLVVLILVLLLSSCASTEFSPYPGAPDYPAYSGELRLLDALPQEGSYDMVGIVIARGVDRTTKQDLIEALKEEAAKRGANAIVLQGDIKLTSRGDSREKVLGAYGLRLRP